MESPSVSRRHAGSFRDPAGFVFTREGKLFRQVNLSGKGDYDRLMQSGLYDALLREGLLIRHSESDISSGFSAGLAYKIIQPEVVPFISYPYEWCFSQLKSAALATIAVARTAFKFGMVLKDASAYNFQFVSGSFKLIDVLSLESYRPDKPWYAYSQFCRHFLAPLSLISFCRDGRMGLLLRDHLDGIPLDLASRILPLRAKFKFSLFSHLYLHSRTQKQYQDKALDVEKFRMSGLQFEALLDSLESAVCGLSLRNEPSAWSGYYGEGVYSARATESKKEIVGQMLESLKPALALDLGANTGIFSRLARRAGAFTVSVDSDHAAVEKNFLTAVKEGDQGLLPLVIDLTNPSPGIGWENSERSSFFGRGPADTVIALGLLHHLAFSNNLPLDKIAAAFSRLGNSLVVEFIPKDDPQCKKMLSNRGDIFPGYTQEAFEREFSRFFLLQDSRIIKDSCRTVYLFTRKEL